MSHISKIYSPGPGYHTTVTFVRKFDDDDVAQSSTSASSRDEAAKYAGQLIYSSVHHDEEPLMPPQMTAAVSSRGPPLLPPEITASLEASNIAQGKMSSVRRTFCLFVLFDLILMFILWVIYTQLIGDTGYTAFERQVERYSFKTSLFDSVMLSAVRFTFLLLAYALLRIQHWWVVALTTALTCAVLIAKIFIFDFSGSHSSNNPLSYCLIIISFVLAWAETWFLDFKVLPHERKKRLEWQRTTRARDYGSTYLGPGLRPPGFDDRQSVITEDNQFYSPMDTPEGSDTEQEGPSANSSRAVTRQENDYIRLAKHSWEVLWTYVHSDESEWKLETGTTEEEGIVHSKKIKGVGKIFRLKVIVDIPVKELFDELTYKPEEQPQWNSAVKEARVLQVVDANTDIIYNISAEIAGGVISSRDFVSLRTWGCRDGIYMGAGMGVNHPDMPPQKNYIRGTNGIGGWVYQSLPEDSSRTLFYWFMNTDIKGWFPQKLIDANMSTVLVDFSKNLKNFVKAMKNS